MMLLVDTSVWIDYLRSGDPQLADHLQNCRVIMHPMILGELACGNLQSRRQLLQLWSSLPQAVPATHDEVMELIEQHKLMGRGIGYVDIHLLASVMMTQNSQLWTRDKRLHKVATDMDLAWTELTH
jgi:hypothetical protein